MGYRIVHTAAGPLLVPDNQTDAPPPADLPAPAPDDAAPPPAAEPSAVAALPPAAEPPPEPTHERTRTKLTLEQRSNAGDFTSPDVLSAASPVTAPPAAEVPVGDAVQAGGDVLGTAGQMAVDVAQAALTPNGIAGKLPPPPPETPEEREARLNGTWDRLAATLPMVPPDQRLDHIQEMKRVGEELKGIYAQRGTQAAQDVAAEQVRLQQEMQRRAAQAEQEAEHRKAVIEADVKAQRDHALKLDEEAANAKIDRSWNPGGTANGIMLAISVALAGLGSALKGQGDKNPALDILMKQIDARVADQWAKKRETHDWAKGQIDRLDVYKNDATLSVDQAKDRAKIALLKDYAAQMEAVASTLPAAKKAALDATVAAARDRVTAMEGAWDAEAYKRSVKAVEDAEKQRHALADEANQRISARAAATSAAASMMNARTNKAQFDFEHDKWFDPTAKKVREAEAEAKIKAATTEDAKKAAEADLARIKAENAVIDQQVKAFMPALKRDANGNVILEKDADGVLRPKVSVGSLLDSNGDPVKLKGSEAEKKHTDDMLSSYRQVQNLVDELTTMIEKNGGWNSKLLDTDEYKDKVAKFQALDLENISTLYQMGVPNGKDDERAHALYGGDPNKFLSVFGVSDPRAGLRSMRENAESKMYAYLIDHSTYDGPQSGIHIPEQTSEGIMHAVENTPVGDALRASKERAGGDITSTGNLAALREWATPEQIAAAQGDATKLPYKGIPSQAAYDTIQQAADIAAGRTGQDPKVGVDTLRAIIKTESHDPVWQLAAKFAFDNGIDLADGLGGINDFFTPQAYKVAADSNAVEVMRTMYGQDPTVGYGGTPEGRAAHKKAAGIPDVTGTEVAPFARRFVPSASAADYERILRATPPGR